LEQAITQWFGGDNCFPQIRSLIIPGDCYSLLKYCPSVRYVHTIGKGSESALTKYGASILADYCPLIENMCLAIPATLRLPLLVQRFLNIRDLTIYFVEGFKTPVPQTFDDLGFILSNFLHLKIVSLHIPLRMHSSRGKQIKSRVKETLLDLQRKDKEERTIILYFSYGSRETITLPWPPIFALQSGLHSDAFSSYSSYSELEW